MTVKSIMKKSERWRIHWVMLALIAFCFGSCKDDDNNTESKPFDPSQPVEITDFTPKEGGVGQRVIIYGKNFGNDPNIVNVSIGGKKAKVIGVGNDGLYILVPSKAYEGIDLKGTIEVRIGDETNPAIGEASEKFTYQLKMVVSTLAGYKNDKGDQPWKDGKFKDPDYLLMASGFKNPSWFKMDPKNPKNIWMVFDNADNTSVQDLYLINFEDSTIVKKKSGFDRPRAIDFTLDGEYMLIAEDRGGENDRNVLRLSRSSGFQSQEIVTKYKQCNTVAIHPVTGDMYFNSFDKGQFYWFDIHKYFADGGIARGVKDANWGDYGKELFTILDPGWEYRIIIHPTGNYAYIVVVNKHYIMRTDYNWVTNRFNPPYMFSGSPSREAGYLDGVGTNTKYNTPYQGVFVYNEEYEKQGRLDHYDFYIADTHNHAIRKLTPDGELTTFAGRGSSSLNPDPWGYVDGDLREEARFDRPTGISYNEEEKVFYIGDWKNNRIRKIGLEEMDLSVSDEAGKK